MKYGHVLLILLALQASSGYAQDSVQVFTGWNIIGSVKAGAIPEVLSTVPDSLITSSYFGYTPGVGYQSTDTLDNGTGYWVKARSDGLIVFHNAPPVDSCKSKAFIYEGKLYHTVLIGDQCWMAENLDVGMMILGDLNQTDNEILEKYCYGNDPLNCALYGGLYQWNEAMRFSTTAGTQGICPPGWHIPTYDDFETLSVSVGGDANSLKTVGQGIGGGGTNTSGFSVLLTGYNYDHGSFRSLGQLGQLWSSTEYNTSSVNALHFSGIRGDIYYTYDFLKDYGAGVRCLED